MAMDVVAAPHFDIGGRIQQNRAAFGFQRYPQRSRGLRAFAGGDDLPYPVELVVAVQGPAVIETCQQGLAVRNDGFDATAGKIRFVRLQRGKREPGRPQRFADDSGSETVGGTADFRAFGHRIRAGKVGWSGLRGIRSRYGDR
jgi:hypothetical protein